MKKLILIAGLVLSGLTFNSQAQQTSVVSTNLGSTNQVFMLLSSRANIKSVQISTAVASGCMVEFFDAYSTAAPYYGTNTTNGIYVSRASSNYTSVTTSIDLTGGTTNYLTNTGIFTYNTTNAAATNAVSAQGTFVQAGNTVGSYTTDMLFQYGVAVRVNTNCSIVVYYNKGN